MSPEIPLSFLTVMTLRERALEGSAVLPGRPHKH